MMLKFMAVVTIFATLVRSSVAEYEPGYREMMEWGRNDFYVSHLDLCISYYRSSPRFVLRVLWVLNLTSSSLRLAGITAN